MSEFDPLNPQAKHMADESMVRNLRHQAEAIWPQEKPLFERYALPEGVRILDVGCGTGEIAIRLGELLPGASVLGVDLIEAHLELARRRAERFQGRVQFQPGNAFALEFGDGAFDLVVCRHMLQAIPHAERAIAEIVRVTRPGGRVHLLVEDYGMIFIHPTRFDAAKFWFEGPRRFALATGTDLHVGRAAYTYLHGLGVERISVDYIAVDTTRVPRETFAQIWIAWRDGYAESVAEYTDYSPQEAVAHFDDMIATIRDPHGFALWLIPVVSGVVPAGLRAPESST